MSECGQLCHGANGFMGRGQANRNINGIPDGMNVLSKSDMRQFPNLVGKKLSSYFSLQWFWKCRDFFDVLWGGKQIQGWCEHRSRKYVGGKS